MGTPGSDTPPRRLPEDPLAQLPCSTIAEYRKGQMVYGPEQPSANIYLVIDGKVKVCRPALGGLQVVVDIYKSDEFFGEVAFLGLPESHELAVAVENTTVMMWTAAEIEEIISRRPKLGIALLQFLVQRSMDFVSRIETFAVDNIARRLARALLRFSERFGSYNDDGTVQMIPFTHELLAQYVGTSREIVTHYMNQFRRDGYLEYSRQGILLRGDALREWLRQNVGQSSSAAA
jgi:CRP/FNR family cyclic AMP-dependent transcriptional regulator